jgi:hypothetical protein
LLYFFNGKDIFIHLIDCLGKIYKIIFLFLNVNMLVNDEIKQEIKKWFNFYEAEIIPVVKAIPEVTQFDYGFHGFYTHTDSVVFRGIYYALYLGENSVPVIFACVCHDLARVDDEYNEVH